VGTLEGDAGASSVAKPLLGQAPVVPAFGAVRRGGDHLVGECERRGEVDRLEACGSEADAGLDGGGVGIDQAFECLGGQHGVAHLQPSSSDHGEGAQVKWVLFEQLLGFDQGLVGLAVLQRLVCLLQAQGEECFGVEDPGSRGCVVGHCCASS